MFRYVAEAGLDLIFMRHTREGDGAMTQAQADRSRSRDKGSPGPQTGLTTWWQ